MKRLTSCVCALLAAFALALCVPGVACASDEPTLVYDGATGEFSFEHAPDGDMFPAFKGLVPGDAVTQDIVVEAIHVSAPVALYVGAFYDDAEIAGIEEIALSVSLPDKTVREGTLGDRHQMGRSALLASFTEDGSVSCRVSIKVPESLGNETSHTAHVLSWTFTAQEEDAPAPPAEGGAGGTAAQTGDPLAGVIGPIAIVAIVALGAFFVALIFRRRSR